MAEVSEKDRCAMARQAAALAEFDCEDSGDDAAREAAVSAADAHRAQAGLPPLKTEVEMHRKAVERGLLRR